MFKGGDKKKHEEDKKLKELYSKWTREQEELLAEWAEKASCYRWLHGRAEKKYRRSNYSFTIPVIIMSTLTGTANFAMDSFVPEEHKKTAMAAVGGVNILAGIISTLQNFLRYAELMESHRASGISWSKLNRDITIELALDPPRRKPARDFLNICRAEYDRLIEQSPMIDDSILNQFHSKFKNTEINKPEMCNGLDKCEIYKPTKEEKVAELMANVTTKITNNKKRMFTIDKPVKKIEPVKESITDNKKELHGLASLGKVSSMKNLMKPISPLPKKTTHDLVKDELKTILEKKDIESLLPESDESTEDVPDNLPEDLVDEKEEIVEDNNEPVIVDEVDEVDEIDEVVENDESNDKKTQTDTEEKEIKDFLDGIKK